MKRLLTFLALAAGPALAVFQHAESAQGRIDAALENSSAMSSLLKLKAEEKLQASWSWEIENPLHVVLAMCFYIAVIPFFWPSSAFIDDRASSGSVSTNLVDLNVGLLFPLHGGICTFPGKKAMGSTQAW